MNVVVTGANGFVGRAVVAELTRLGCAVRPVTRKDVGGISGSTDWKPLLSHGDVVIHTAAAVHLPSGVGSPHHPDVYETVNVEGTRRLAMDAVSAGVRRLLFISSIKVNGESTGTGDFPSAFTSLDIPKPAGRYAQSKWAAENVLREVSSESPLQVVIVRPPLVYGPGVRANFAALIKAVRMGLPLPFRSIGNLRSFVAIENLLDLLLTCIRHPAAANRTFLVSDGHDLSTADLIAEIAVAFGKRPRLFDCNPGLLRVGARLLGREEQMRRLIESLQVDIGDTCRTLDWRPKVPIRDAIQRLARDRP